MKRNYAYLIPAFLLLFSVTLVQCRKEAVAPVIPDTTTPGTNTIPDASEVNYFVWSTMHDVYLWNTNVNGLSNTNYQPLTTSSPNYKRNKDSLNAYLNKFTDPNLLFNSLLYQKDVVDKWSFIVNDYSIIDNWIAGISKTMGYDFQLYLVNSTSTDVMGVIRYVLPGSPAEQAGLKRGDIFIKIDGTQLNTTNYQTLIAKESFALTLATLSNNTLTPGITTPVMTAVQMQENPIFTNKVITANGTKVGYLMYNGFTSDYDVQLNTVLQQFKTAGISKIIVDLRYNGGGSVQTAIYLASMIYSTDNTKIFCKSVYNSILQQAFSNYYGTGFDLNYFANKISATSTSAGATINSLNLSDIYFIVSKETASASELLINGLRPYMNVTVVGTNTYGKYVGSQTFKDLDANGNVVTTHKWAMQPIIVKIANSQGVSDYVSGLTPDITAKEDVGNLLPLGDENEALLKVCLDRIKGLKSASVVPATFLSKSQSLIGSADLQHFSREMYVQPRAMKRQQ
ncbi:MAG: S41 family peptidase [Marinilabiliales bacterium]|nr:S41 family peptidase [Marinilabiliales bacterium]